MGTGETRLRRVAAAETSVGVRLLLLAITLLTLLDNVMGAWLHEQMRNPGLSLAVIYVKYALFAGAFGVFLIDLVYGRPVLRYEWSGLAYLTLVTGLSFAILVLFPGHDAGSRFYLYVFPIVIYFGGAAIGRRAAFDLRFLVQLYLICYLSCAGVFLILNLRFGAVEFWRDYLNYTGFILDIKGFTDDVIDGLHGNFYYDTYGAQIPRFVGSFGDPLALAYSGMILLPPTWSLFPRQRLLLCSLVALVIAGSLTRAILLVLPIAIAIFLVFRQRGFWIMITTALLGVAAVLVFGESVAQFFGNSSTTGHISSVSEVYGFLDAPGLIGGTLLSGKDSLFEPGFFNVLFSFGGVSLACLLIFLAGLYQRSAKAGSGTPYIAVVLLAGGLTLSLISSAFFATTSGWFAWFLAGFASRRSFVALSGPATPGASPFPTRSALAYG